ncbi:hypothetical protein JCM11641_005897 [Rhodosporidiobolus odoratus]
MSLLIRKIGQTVFPEVAPAAIWFTLIAVATCIGCDQTGYELVVNTVMLSILSTMLSFVISLRTSSALERWNAGRQAWTQISLASRNLAALIWIQIGPTTLNAVELAQIVPGSDEEEIENIKGLIEKRTMLGLLQAFSVAIKHYVRSESSIFYDDLYDLVKALPKYSFPSGIEDDMGNMNRENLAGIWRSPAPDGTTVIPIATSTARQSHSLDASLGCSTSSTLSGSHIDLEKGTHSEIGALGKDGKIRKIKLTPGYNPPERGLAHYAPIFLLLQPIIRFFSHEQRRNKSVSATNIPLEIHLFLSGYIATSIRRGTLAAPLVGVAMGYHNQLADSLAIIERVLSTPLPFAYKVHLRAVTYVFLVFLPFQIFASLGYLTILAEFVAAVVFLGFQEIAEQMEQPFGFDDSDLPLDALVSLLSSELQEIAAHPAPSPSSFVFSPLNTPFAPFDCRSAPEILADFSISHGGTDQAGVKGVPGMRRYLAKHLHELEERAKKAREAARNSHKSSRQGSMNWADVDGPREVDVCVV